MPALFVFGLGYTASRLAQHVSRQGWHVAGTGRAGLRFDDNDTVRRVLASATHVLSSVPPIASDDADIGMGVDPVLAWYGDALGDRWLGYLSSTGVYGDTGGAWVDESAPLGGRRAERTRADRDWLARGARVLRLPGIYGPGRSALDRVARGDAHRVDAPGQIFSRIHVDDIVTGVAAAFDAPPGAYNLADDRPASQNDVMVAAAALLGMAPPPFVPLEQLSPMARGFYAENRRVANGKAKRVLRWTPAYPDFVSGLGALSAMSNPTSATAPPAAASIVQR